MLEVMSKSERLQRCGSLKRTPTSPRSPTSPSQGIQFDKVTVIAPSGKVLARELTFQVHHFVLFCPCSLPLSPHLPPPSLPSVPSSTSLPSHLHALHNASSDAANDVH